jgi:hypothetical protein
MAKIRATASIVKLCEPFQEDVHADTGLGLDPHTGWGGAGDKKPS